MKMDILSELPEKGIWLMLATSIFIFSFFVIFNFVFLSGVYKGVGVISFNVSQEI